MIERSASLDFLLPQADVLSAALERGIDAARAHGHAVLVSVVFPYRTVDLKSLTSAFDGVTEDASFWRQPGGQVAVLGVGAALRLSGTGDSRFRTIQTQWEKLMNAAVICEFDTGLAAGVDSTVDGQGSNDAAVPVGPLLMGGFAFDPLSQKDHVWQCFPDGLMILPQAMITWTPQSQWLTLNRLVSETSDVRREADVLYRQALGLEAALAAGGVEAHGEGKVQMDEGDVEAWKRAVADAARIIRSGRLEKTVLARSVRTPLPRGSSPGRVLDALMASYPECYTFAFRLGERSFVGATPERLIALRGLDVETMAVAGSIARSSDPEEDFALGQALLSDSKNLWEHRIVVDSIREGLSAVCARLDIADRPRLLKVRNVQHLWTPVSGRLDRPRSVLELVARLHPTPAVGGHPTPAALKLIREIEGMDRGWYAGPVGWMDAKSDGEFAVALRSALIGAGEAVLFAGCGIMGDSDPKAEYDESALKLKAMIQALERSSR